MAATFLLNQGLKLIAQNYHCRYGEIDLIVQDAKTLVFVEVRLRKKTYSAALAAVLRRKKCKS